MKKLICIILSAVFIMTVLGGCAENSVNNSKTESTDKNKISIVATIFPQYDFARAIAGDKADVIMLVAPGTEIHSYDPSPADIIKIQKADVFIYTGGEADVWVNKILLSMDISKKKIVRIMDCIDAVEEETVAGMQSEEEEKRAQDEIEYDEHIWTSPKNAIKITNAIATAICEADSANSDVYSINAEAYTSEIADVDDQIQTIVDNAKFKIIVVGDKFPFRYFVDEYGLDYKAAFNGCSTETEASAKTITYLIDTVKSNNISSVFYIELSNQNIAKAISEQTGAKMLLLNSCHNVSKYDFVKGVTYVSLMKDNAENLNKGLN